MGGIVDLVRELYKRTRQNIFPAFSSHLEPANRPSSGSSERDRSQRWSDNLKTETYTKIYVFVAAGGAGPILSEADRRVLEAEAAAPGSVLDHAFLAEHASGVEETLAHLSAVDEAEFVFKVKDSSLTRKTQR